MTMNTIILMLLLVVPAAKERAWQDGLLTDVTDHSSTSTITGPNILTGEQEVRHTVGYDYTIQTAERFYVARYVPGLKWGELNCHSLDAARQRNVGIGAQTSRT